MQDACGPWLLASRQPVVVADDVVLGVPAVVDVAACAVGRIRDGVPDLAFAGLFGAGFDEEFVAVFVEFAFEVVDRERPDA